MPRPKLRSDDEVLDAAAAVLKRRGPTDFTLADVADAVGLARATLIQRFGSRDALLVRLTERNVALTAAHLDALPAELGPFLDQLLRGMGAGYDVSINLLIGWYEVQVPALRALAAERNRLVQAAIQRRMPAGAPADAGELVHGAIAAATLQWLAAPAGPLADFALARVGRMLGLLGLPAA